MKINEYKTTINRFEFINKHLALMLEFQKKYEFEHSFALLYAYCEHKMSLEDKERLMRYFVEEIENGKANYLYEFFITTIYAKKRG